MDWRHSIGYKNKISCSIPLLGLGLVDTGPGQARHLKARTSSIMVKSPTSTGLRFTSKPMGADANHSQTETSPEGVDALIEAARYDDIDDIVSLESAGVSLDSKDSLGRTALHMAAANNLVDVVEYLISHGVDVNASNEEKNTPLHWACLNGHVEVVKKLILAGANISSLNRTPLDEALNLGKMDVVDAINAAVAQLELTGVRVS